MKEQKKKVPDLRFKGFTDDWEQRKFMDLIDSIIDFRGRTPKKLGMNWSNEGLLALSAQNVKDGYIDKTIDTHYGSQTLYDKWMNGRELHKGQVVFTTEAPMGNVARIPDENKYILSQRTIAFTVKNTVLTEGFLMYLLESPSVKNNLLRISSGGTAKGVSQKTLSSLTVKIPTSLKEQERINFVFYSLDSLITLHQRKLVLLKQLKEGLLQKMFADKDSKQPILRFKGFHDDWEQRRLGEVAEIKTGSRNHQDSVDNGKYPFFIRSEKVERLNEYDFDTKAILVPGDGRIGEIFHYYDGKFALHQRVYKVDNFKEVNPLYLLNLFKYKFKKHALRLNAQGTVPSLRLPMFTNWNILIPNLNEQQKIGLFFQQLDSLITLQQRKQNHLKLLKKSLLQQMFI